MLRLAEWSAEEERMLALVSVDGSSTIKSVDPLEGDMLVCNCNQGVLHCV